MLLFCYLKLQLVKIFLIFALVFFLLEKVLIKFHVRGSLLQEERQLLYGRQLRASAFNV